MSRAPDPTNLNPDPFVIKDSGVRKEFDSGMRRDTNEGKPRYDLLWEPTLTRFAIHMGKGSAKYGERNWQKANSQEEMNRFLESGCRHFVQWCRGDVDEDHLAATWFNMQAFEYVKDKMQNTESLPVESSCGCR